MTTSNVTTGEPASESLGREPAPPTVRTAALLPKVAPLARKIKDIHDCTICKALPLESRDRLSSFSAFGETHGLTLKSDVLSHRQLQSTNGKSKLR